MNERLLVDIARAVLGREEAEAWTVEPGDFWCLLTPPGHRRRDQGWKLHLSATQLSAPVVLAGAAEVLVRAGCQFKFARGLEQLGMLLSVNCDRGSGGKFITAYPAGDEQFRRLAAELDRVTEGLPGPVILSDRRLRPDGLVHYRYGVFAAEPVFTNDGGFESVVSGPGGQRRKDERQAWFSAPPWVTPPLPDPAPAPPGEPKAVLVADRFVVREAIRQSYRGGVYRGIDRRTGDEVILKQARPHVMGQLDGTDARDRLRHEADVLDRLAPLGFTPGVVALVTQQDNLFLVQEQVPGVTLREWAAHERSGVMDKARQLVDLMAAVHEQGLVLRDFSPNNLMVTPEGQIRLIDLEHAAPAGARVRSAYTQGYAAPEQESAPTVGPAPSQRADLYGLGATLVYLASAVDPLLAPDEPAVRPGEERVAEFVAALGADVPALRRLSPLVLGLMKDDPDQRWPLSRAREFLESGGVSLPGTAVPARTDRLIADGLTHLLRTMDPMGPRLWTAGESGASADPLNVQFGAAGVLSVLTRSAQVLDRPELLAAVADVVAWIRPRLFAIPRILPGLYFGRSGTAWALYDAARLLGDEEAAAQAVELAARVPVQWPNHDVCHGSTGAGMLHLHLWRATGDPAHLDRFTRAADRVLAAAREREDGLLVWPIPETFDSALAGLVHYGFAHGVAGAGAFMTYAWQVTGRAGYLEAARRAAETLEAVAITEGDAAWWPSGELGDSAGDRMRHWCSGASGVGTFLIRLWQVTGQPRHRELAEAAGVAIRREKWHAGLASCHGLAGDGDFLLDLAEFTGERRFHDWAAELATAMEARNTLRDGLMVLPDESGVEVHAGYGTGLSGALAFLLRLRHGGPRQWMPRELRVDTPSTRSVNDVVTERR
ncbi:class IV lanthionine synthetase LanL [Nonomuraea sp. NPDC050556]|uniref:class IV lanthionine synthetase LanL n=1 Tax=Nonomuraea sp. NPDC050556 TaxID=3364369 RepID=UPI003787AE4E